MVEDLLTDRVMMPPSRTGNSKTRTKEPIPITPVLAMALKVHTAGRVPNCIEATLASSVRGVCPLSG